MAGKQGLLVHQGADAGIVRFLKPDGLSHAGMGILVDRRRIVTCAHVVNTALGRDQYATDTPVDKACVNFPLSSSTRKIIAGTVVSWKPVGGEPEDIAVLELSEDAPTDVGFAVLTHFEASLQDNPLKIFGIASGSSNHVDVKYQGLTASFEAQIDGHPGAATFVERGYSGAGVWDAKLGAFIGMVRAVAAGGKRIAYLTPVISLQAACPSLPVERRELSPTFRRTWTIASVAFFMATFYFFGANLWWDKSNHPQLAAFFGMHLYPFVGALIGWLLLSHARNFKFHPWSTRVPGIIGLNHESGSPEEKNWAALFLIVLVAFPVYAQGHFLSQFHTEGHVYLYPKDFGFKPHDLQALIKPGDGLACLRGPLENGTAKCRHPTADLYRIAQPKPGYKGGYWKNAYHYGDYRGSGRQSASFWPILQPVVVIALSILTLVLNAWAVLFVFRDHRARLLESRDVEGADKHS